MTSITISGQQGIDKVLGLIGNTLSKKNLSYIVAQTLTSFAKDGQAEIVGGLPSDFVIRRQWVPNGIKITPATPGSLEAQIVSLDSGGRRGFMTIQEFGGIKTPQTSRTLAIPLTAVKPTPETLVPNALKPKALTMWMQRGGRLGGKRGLKQSMNANAIIVTSKTNPDHKYILIKKNGKYVPGWLLVRSAKIKETDFFYGPARKVITPDAIYQRLISRVLDELNRS